MIKAIFFDIDNTLLDFDAYVKESLRAGLSEFGITEYSDEVYETFERINTELWHRIELGTLTYEELMKIRWNTVFSALGVSGDGIAFEKYFKERLFHNAITVEGAIDILQYLHGRYILAAASNGPYLQQENRLKISGMKEYFDFLFISESIGYSKPSGEFFDYCLKEVNMCGSVSPSEILMVGDSLTSDITGAVNAGMLTCYFDKNGKGDTKGLKPDYVIKELSEIRKIL